MKKHLLPFLILNCIVCFVNASFAQIKFVFNDTIHVTKYGKPLADPWAGGINYPMWNEIDLNQDNKKDLLMFDRSDNRITILMNDGSAGPQAFHFDSNSVKYANMFPELKGWAFLYDYNADGLPDVFTVDGMNTGIIAYKSSIVSGTWKFTPVASPIMSKYGPAPWDTSNIAASGYLTPFFVDMDGDGDMDILTPTNWPCVGTFVYYENQSMQLYGTTDSLTKFNTITNSWGHFALRSGAFCDVLDGFDSIFCRPSSSPITWDPTELARRDDSYACITALNLNGDTLIDAVIGDSQARNLLALRNIGTRTDAWMDSASQDFAFPSYDKPARLSFFNCPTYVDVDNDGLKDMIVGNREYENRKGMLYYKNKGSNPGPVYDFQNDSLFQSGMLDAGEGAAAVFFDENNDGLLDMIIGAIHSTDTSCFSNPYKSTLTLYRNTGSATNPAFQFVTDDYGGLSALSYPLPFSPFYPTFGDLSCDGQADMIVGGHDGKLMYFKNKALSGPAVFAFPPDASFYMGIDVGNSAMPQLIDLNKDGNLDLVIGRKDGKLQYFQNNGSCTSPFSMPATISSFGGVDLRYPNSQDGYTVPYIFEDNGKFKMLVSWMKGEVYLYDNVDTFPGSTFTLVDTILKKDYGNRFGFGISVGGGDINGDGDADMVLGLYGGGVQIYYGDFPIGINEANEPQIKFNVYPNPVSEMLNVSIQHSNAPKALCTLSVFNSIGEIVYSQKASRGNHVIQTKRFSNGIYLVQIRTNEQNVSVRIVINH